MVVADMHSAMVWIDVVGSGWSIVLENRLQKQFMQQAEASAIYNNKYSFL